jgi:predicted enzyme related to lactoylglutathione lyase
MAIKLSLTALDCPEPIPLANFYAALLGLEVEPLGDFKPEDVNWIEVLDDGKRVLGFQQVPNFVAPTWPEGPVPQQLHLDFHSDDLDKDEAHALAVGARKTDFQPGETFRVFLDPVGHPFCLVLRHELREE